MSLWRTVQALQGNCSRSFFACVQFNCLEACTSGLTLHPLWHTGTYIKGRCVRWQVLCLISVCLLHRLNQGLIQFRIFVATFFSFFLFLIFSFFCLFLFWRCYFCHLHFLRLAVLLSLVLFFFQLFVCGLCGGPLMQKRVDVRLSMPLRATGIRVRACARACVCVCVCAVSYTHLTLPTRSTV